MELFVSIIIVVFGFLQIVLFFKIWEMTNDVKKMANHFCPSIQPQHKNNNAVVSATNETVEIISYTGDKYRCYNPNTMETSLYNKNELIFK